MIFEDPTILQKNPQQLSSNIKTKKKTDCTIQFYLGNKIPDHEQKLIKP